MKTGPIDRLRYHEIALDRGMSVVFISDDPAGYLKSIGMTGDEASYVDRSFNIGGDEVVLGFYEDPELLCISFFHEIGHKLLEDADRKNRSSLEIELRCWELGIREAHRYGVTFSDKALIWGYGQAFTYVEKETQ